MSRSRAVNSHYDLLGIPPHATEMEIRSAYGRDVLKLQESASDKVAQFRTALDAAFPPRRRTSASASGRPIPSIVPVKTNVLRGREKLKRTLAAWAQN